MDEFADLAAADESLNRVKRLVVYLLQVQRTHEEEIQILRRQQGRFSQYKLETEIHDLKVQQHRLTRGMKNIQRRINQMPPLTVVEETTSPVQTQQKQKASSPVTVRNQPQQQQDTASEPAKAERNQTAEALTKGQKQSLERMKRAKKFDKRHQMARKNARK